jgi:cell division protein FtsB
MSAIMETTPAVVLSREDKIRPETRQLSPSSRFSQMLTNHPSYQQKFGGKKHTRRETRLMDIAAMTAADLSYCTSRERAQSAFWQIGRLFSAGKSGEDRSEISWFSKYFTLPTVLPVAVVIIGGLFTFLTWTVEHNATEKRDLSQYLSQTREDLVRTSGLPEMLLKNIGELTKENKTLRDEKDGLIANVSALKQQLADSQAKVGELKKKNDALSSLANAQPSLSSRATPSGSK